MTFKIITDKNLTHKQLIDKIEKNHEESKKFINNKANIKELDKIIKKFKYPYAKNQNNNNNNYNTSRNYFSNDKDCNNIKIYDSNYSSNMSRHSNNNSNYTILYGPQIF